MNLSPYGAAIEHDGCFREGMSTMLLFENGEEHRGVVRWSDGGRAGLYLTEPFPCARLESANAILELSGRAPQRTGDCRGSRAGARRRGGSARG